MRSRVIAASLLWIGLGGLTLADGPWAFQAPVRPTVPAVEGDWARGEIDRFILEKLRANQLEPSTEADRLTLVRRLYLDLTGLPPTPEEADAFARNTAPDAYEVLVQSLLDSPRYGEHWALRWLDLARYADTAGDAAESRREVWPYRDWLVRALNQDLPFDQFTVQQLAGDLLPKATYSQRVATGFLRQTWAGQGEPEANRFQATVERTGRIGSVWMGLSTGCALCHDHKAAPLTQTDFYRLAAIFNSLEEADVEAMAPEELEKARAELRDFVQAAELRLVKEVQPARFEAWLKEQRAAVTSWKVLRPSEMKSPDAALEVMDDGSVFATGEVAENSLYALTLPLNGLDKPVTALRLEAMPDDRLPGKGPGRSTSQGRAGEFFLSEVVVKQNGEVVALATASQSYGSGQSTGGEAFDGNPATGWSLYPRAGEEHELVMNLDQALPAKGTLEVTLAFEGEGAALGRFRISAANATKPALARAGDALNPSDSSRNGLMLDYVRYSADFANERREIDALRAQMPESPRSLAVRESAESKPAFRYENGDFTQPREAVTPGVPGALPPLDGKLPANRLNFANWLVSGEHPLTARVAVNRAWQAFFGRGLVAGEDFGAAPIHPELLDWLAREFVEKGWSMKELHRWIVTSAVYRQSSEPSQVAQERDPENVYLSHASRWKLDPEQAREVKLRSAGGLQFVEGGPGIELPRTRDEQGRLRFEPLPMNLRSLYFSRRRGEVYQHEVTVPGETCAARRQRLAQPRAFLDFSEVDKPLALARSLEFRRAGAEGKLDPSAQATLLFRSCLTREPTAEELASMVTFYEMQSNRLATEDQVETKEICEGGPSAASTPSRAAWILTAQALFNLEEMVTRK